MSNRICTINHIVLENVSRPSLHFERLVENKVGRSSYSAVLFTATLDPFDYLGDFSMVTLIVSPCEKWQFFDAKIALMPETLIDKNRFVMIFDKCQRVGDKL